MRALSGLAIGAITTIALAGCWAQGEPDSPLEAAERLRAEPIAYAKLHAALAQGPAVHPLVVRETGLAELELGTDQAQVRARYGAPARTVKSPEGTWWEYEGGKAGAPLRLLFAGESLVQIQAWPPSAHETRTLIRVLDAAARVRRKYGEPAQKLPLGSQGAEVWVYPPANAAFVVTPPGEAGRRSVGAVIVGL